MEPRGRGRSYGRARGTPTGQQQPQRPGGPPQQQRPGGPPQQQRPPQQQQPGGQQRPPPPQQQQPGGQQRPPPRAAPPGGAWARPATAQPPTAAWPRPTMGAPQPQPTESTFGRGGREAEGAIPRKVVGQGQGQGDDAGGSGGGGDARGSSSSVRGRVVNRQELLFTRPDSVAQSKKGATGNEINLVANYLPLVYNAKWCLSQYRVDMAPDIDHTGKRKALVRDATRDLFTGGYLFDGTVLCSPQRIENNLVERFVKDGEDDIRITIRLVGDVAWGDSHYIQLFNILIRKCLQLMGLQQVGREYYMPDSKIMINEHKIQLWPGYFTSMRQHEAKILLNVDLQFKFMRTDNVYDLLMECMRERDGRTEFTKRIIGSVVLTYYNNKTYKIDDVDWNSTPNNTFKMKDGTDISFKQYFQKKYKCDIRVPDQPMLISRSKPREIRAGMSETVTLVPELCQMTGLTDKQRENFSLMKTLANHTRIGVEARIEKLREFSRKIHSKPEVVEEIRRWDLAIGDNLVTFKGRVLPTEWIVGCGTTKYSAGPQADWTRELRSRPMCVAPKLDRLAIVCTTRQMRAVEDFMRTLRKAAAGMSWEIGATKTFELGDNRAAAYLQEIDTIVSKHSPTLILCILPNNSADRYSAIKKKCYVDRGIPTQMFVERNLTNKGVMSIATKVAIQMNCKIGGAPWSIGVPLSNLMVVGYDVCRDTVNKKKSFSGMVASLDRQMTRYYSVTSEHQMEEELSNNFGTFLLMACNRYKQVNGVYPDRIMIFRDGVGAGQLPYVYKHEVVSIKERLTQDIYKDTPLKLAFIVVSKRINTRIMTMTDNPPPGTVVDDVITLPERYDFYIVSQCVRQGTVSPTNYNVIEDTLGLAPDRLQMLTYKLTHLYYNWSGTVRVPAPCQYAHKLAFMVSQNLHRPAHRDLEDVLYYL